MTGIERLRELTMKRDTITVPAVSGTYGAGYMAATMDMIGQLRDIADQIEREHAEECFRMGECAADVSMSAYDLLPEDEREAIAWVREHGGLSDVRLCHNAADNRRVELCAALGIDLETGWADAMKAMRPRLMPEGMEWPTFEDRELVRIGDEVQTAAGGEKLRHLSMCSEGCYLRTDTCDEWHCYGEPIKRPTPKVLDADGAEIELGDDLYSVEGSLKFHVSHVDRINGKIATDAMFSLDKWADPAMYTHRAPVLAADGRPLREGETVWHKSGFASGVVVSIDAGSLMHTVRYRDEGGAEYRNAAKDLTHERPDSWERLEEDADGIARLFEGMDEDASADIRDLVRRARALAGDA